MSIWKTKDTKPNIDDEIIIEEYNDKGVLCKNIIIISSLTYKYWDDYNIKRWAFYSDIENL